MSDPVRAVYDCMIFLQAAARPDRVHGTFRLVREGRVTLCVSAAVIDEVRDVLTRPEVRAKFPALTPEHVDAFLSDLLTAADLTDHVPTLFTLPRDPKDEPYLNLAIQGPGQLPRDVERTPSDLPDAAGHARRARLLPPVP